MGYPPSTFLFSWVCAAPSTASSLSNRYWAGQTNKLGQSTQASSVVGLLLRVETNTVYGFPYLELSLNEVSGGFQYAVSIDTPVQIEKQGFSTLLMTISAANTSKQLVLFQARPTQKRIRPFSVRISLEVWSLDLAEFKWLRIAVIAFLTLAWGLPLHWSAPLLSAGVNIASVSGFSVSLPKPLNSSCDTTVQGGKLQHTGSPETCHKPHVSCWASAVCLQRAAWS